MKNLIALRWCQVLAVSLILGLVVVAANTFWCQIQPQTPAYVQKIGADFTLRSTNGPLALHDFRGQVVLLYFGYTHCPDACPTALGTISGAIRELPLTMRSRVAGLFVSLDPERDTPAICDAYAHFFHPAIHGVTGTPTQLAKIARSWRVNYAIPSHAPGSNYALSHSTFIYLVDTHGKVRALFGDHSTRQEISRELRVWLSASLAS
ncbi:MAG: SCO family protein [Mariprofundales bacterium]|nr:SCO family protein [Mariprofundales bacterium]